MRNHGKDTRARNKQWRRPMLVGMGNLVCPGCESELVFAASERPTVCHLCGTDIPEAQGLKPSAFSSYNRKKPHRRAAFVAGFLRQLQEVKMRRESP